MEPHGSAGAWLHNIHCHPCAKLDFRVPERKLKFGVLKGRIKVSDDFDAPLTLKSSTREFLSRADAVYGSNFL